MKAISVSRLCAAVLGLALYASAASASVRPCATPEEQSGLDVRAMQSELMVAALTCNQRDHYNRFVSANDAYLKGAGRDMKNYFSRVYSDQAPRRINAFVTALANRTSEVSLNLQIQQYCRNAGMVFNMLNRGQKRPEELSRYFSHLHAIQSCDQ